ncbi:MAG: (d)CMP kinase [Mogibacterium sp.]|nr:(d)CMP kinase [Mogibacterium sp.]
MLDKIRIAIDGPGGAGKSTIAKLVAGRLQIEYIDTGAMYRAIALKALRAGVSEDDTDALDEMLAGTTVDFDSGRILLDGEDVSEDIRTQEVSMAASDYSKLAAVRSKLVALQREIAAGKSVVMDGRDIGSNVLPDAELKIYLTADPMVRAKRRYDEMIENGKEADLDQIYREMVERDYQDMHRELNPLTQAEDAVLLDTSPLNIEQVVAAVIDEVVRTGYPVEA